MNVFVLFYLKDYRGKQAVTSAKNSVAKFFVEVIAEIVLSSFKLFIPVYDFVVYFYVFTIKKNFFLNGNNWQLAIDI